MQLPHHDLTCGSAMKQVKARTAFLTALFVLERWIVTGIQN